LAPGEGFWQFDTNLEPFENDHICGGRHQAAFAFDVDEQEARPNSAQASCKRRISELPYVGIGIGNSLQADGGKQLTPSSCELPQEHVLPALD
jgi:hypothetical protein